MKIKKFAFAFFFTVISISSFAQYDYPGEEDAKTVKAEKKSWYSDSKLFFGGVPGLMFGSTTYIELPPYVGYKFTPYILAGVGPLYQYYKERTIHYETSIYGGKLFTQVFLIKNLEEKIRINLGDLFLYGESSMLNIEPYTVDSNYNITKLERKWLNVTLIGFGFRYPIGYRSGFSLNILWDVSRNPDYPSFGPEVRVGFDL